MRSLDRDTPASTGSAPLLPALFEHATRMNFIRFCELLELAAPHLPGLGTAESPAADPVRFRASAGLGFPAREIEAIRFDDARPGAPASVITTFLGLHGVDARMPSGFVDAIAQRREGAEPLAAFLDIFHHRIVTQFYRVARKYRYPIGFRPDGSDPVSSYLLGFAGFGFGRPDRAGVGASDGPLPDTRRLLSMLGLAMQKTRTAEGLVGVLRHVVPEGTIEVAEFHPVWRVVTNLEPAPLGEHCLLGRGFVDRMNAVRVVITPASRDAVLSLVPGQAVHRELMMLLRFYLGYASEAELEMQVRADLMPQPVLASRQVALGFSSQLDAPDTHMSVRFTRVRLGCWRGAGDPRS